ncbi:hypothetical protein D3C87_1915650 [compost metagenome]
MRIEPELGEVRNIVERPATGSEHQLDAPDPHHGFAQALLISLKKKPHLGLGIDWRA